MGKGIENRIGCLFGAQRDDTPRNQLGWRFPLDYRISTDVAVFMSTLRGLCPWRGSRSRFLVRLLSRKDSGELNTDILVRAQAGDQDQITCQVHDFHWFAHVRHEDPPPLPIIEVRNTSR
jgi:hypothetical protein